MTKRQHVTLSRILSELPECQHKKSYKGVGGHPIWWCPECGALSRGEAWMKPSVLPALPAPMKFGEWIGHQLNKQRANPIAWFMWRTGRWKLVWWTDGDDNIRRIRRLKDGMFRRFSLRLRPLDDGQCELADGPGVVFGDRWEPYP